MGPSGSVMNIYIYSAVVIQDKTMHAIYLTLQCNHDGVSKDNFEPGSISPASRHDYSRVKAFERWHNGVYLHHDLHSLRLADAPIRVHQHTVY